MNKTLKLHTALKVKNRLAGEVARLQEIIRRENSRRNDNQSTIDVGKLIKQLALVRGDLSAIKAAIAQANVKIYSALEQLAESKAHMAFLQTIPTRQGPEREQSYGKEDVIYHWTAHLNQEAIDKLLAEQQDKINGLQDEVDAFNAGESITVNFLSK